MSFGERAYNLLLHVYPGGFLRAYREPLRQAFRDQSRDAGSLTKRVRLWARLLVDLARSAPAVHADERGPRRMNFTTPLAYLFCSAAMIFVGRFELRTDDAGVVVFFVLAMTLVLGCLHPRRAWQWGFAGWCVPIAELFWGTARGHLGGAPGAALLLAFVTGIGLAGGYAGAWLRRAAGGRRV